MPRLRISPSSQVTGSHALPGKTQARVRAPAAGTAARQRAGQGLAGPELWHQCQEPSPDGAQAGGEPCGGPEKARGWVAPLRGPPLRPRPGAASQPDPDAKGTRRRMSSRSFSQSRYPTTPQHLPPGRPATRRSGSEAETYPEQ